MSKYRIVRSTDSIENYGRFYGDIIGETYYWYKLEKQKKFWESGFGNNWSIIESTYAKSDEEAKEILNRRLNKRLNIKEETISEFEK